jgi:anhydro-N-acetylmuramic acid kinase
VRVIALGLMSGTSLDGIDAALVRIVPQGESYGFEMLRFLSVPYENELLREIRAALPPNNATPAQLTGLHRDLGTAFARVGRMATSGMRVDYVASHGQTIWHDGSRHRTMQLGDPFILREALCATVCYDFRSADCAVGGHGAPLVPYVDALLVASPSEDRVALNIGGIANLTALPAGVGRNDVIAYDVGPGNMLIDAFVYERTRGVSRYDAFGALAARGTVHDAALRAMLADEYFTLAPPKSTGRERFGEQFLEIHDDVLATMSLEDGCATLTELTSASIASEIERLGLGRARVIVSGGGVKNETLMARIQARLAHARVESSDAIGIPADAKEALAFAILGYETLRERAANVPRVTGASRAVPLGAIAPFDFAHLYAEVQRECHWS